MYYEDDEEIDFDPMPSTALMLLRSLAVSMLLSPCAFLFVLLSFVLPGVFATISFVTGAILLVIATVVGLYGIVRGVIHLRRGCSVERKSAKSRAAARGIAIAPIPLTRATPVLQLDLGSPGVQRLLRAVAFVQRELDRQRAADTLEIAS